MFWGAGFLQTGIQGPLPGLVFNGCSDEEPVDKEPWNNKELWTTTLYGDEDKDGMKSKEKILIERERIAMRLSDRQSLLASQYFKATQSQSMVINQTPQKREHHRPVMCSEPKKKQRTLMEAFSLPLAL